VGDIRVALEISDIELAGLPNYQGPHKVINRWCEMMKSHLLNGSLLWPLNTVDSVIEGSRPCCNTKDGKSITNVLNGYGDQKG